MKVKKNNRTNPCGVRVGMRAVAAGELGGHFSNPTDLFAQALALFSQIRFLLLVSGSGPSRCGLIFL